MMCISVYRSFLSGSDYIHFYRIVMNSFYDTVHYVNPSLVIVLRPSATQGLKGYLTGCNVFSSFFCTCINKIEANLKSTGLRNFNSVICCFLICSFISACFSIVVN